MKRFEKAVGSVVSGLTRKDFDDIVDLSGSAGWAVMKRVIGAIADEARPAVYENADPGKQLLLHQGLGTLFALASIESLVSSAKEEAALALQREIAASETKEQDGTVEV